METKAPTGYFGDWTDINHPGMANTPLGKRGYYIEITKDKDNSVIWLDNADYNADVAAADKGGTKLVTSTGVETTVTIYDTSKDPRRTYNTDNSGKAANEDTGDKITPREIQYDYKLMLEDRHIQVMAYNLATILAEKLETVISRSDQNTRPRDYYDVYILTKLQAENIDFPALGAALMATASKRGSDSILQDYRAIVEAVRNSEIMRRQWDNYRKDFDYASTISFDEVCDAVASTMDTLITNNFF